LDGVKKTIPRIDKSTLHFFVRRPDEIRPKRKHSIEVELCEVIERNAKNGELWESPNYKLRFICKKSIMSVIFKEDGQWLTIPRQITKKTIPRWIHYGQPNFGMVLRAKLVGDVDSTNLAVTEITPEYVSKRPFLEIPRMRDSESRIKQSPDQNQLGDVNANCHRYPLNVDFKTIGFTFVVYPTSIQDSYCAGQCSSHSNNLVVKPFCTPSKYRDVTIVYQDSNHMITFGTMPGLSVEQCNCSEAGPAHTSNQGDGADWTGSRELTTPPDRSSQAPIE
jgi:hypothetical protein